MNERRSCWNQWLFFFTRPIYHRSLRQTSSNIREVCVPSSSQEICDTQLKGKGNIWEHGSFLCSHFQAQGKSDIFPLASSLTPKAETQPCGTVSKPCVVTPTGRYFPGNFHRSFLTAMVCLASLPSFISLWFPEFLCQNWADQVILKICGQFPLKII